MKIKHIFRDVKKGKIVYSSDPLSLLSNASRINIRRPVQVVTTKSLGVTHCEISLGQLEPTK
jgi:hypothetical protein